MEKVDVAVVGGSIAGSVASYLLGLEGKSVITFEPEIFPRHRACGEGLSLLGVNLLRRIGLWTPEIEAQCIPFNGYNLHLANGASLELQPGPLGSAQGYGVYRHLLDSTLHRAAATSTKVVRAKVTRFMHSGDRWEVNSSAGSVLARELIIAWGSSSGKREREVNISTDRRGHRYGLAVWLRGQWSQPGDRLIHVFQRESCQFLTTPVSSDTLNVSVLANRFAERRLSKAEMIDWARYYAETIGFAVHEVLSVAGSAEIHSERNRPGVPGAYCVGDALERYDPIGGLGMTNAISSAMLISRVLQQKFRRKANWQVANRAYLGLVRGQSRHFRNLTRLNVAALTRLSPDVLSALGRYPVLGSKILEFTKAMSYRSCMSAIERI